MRGSLSGVIGVVFVAGLFSPVVASPIRRHHHPWLMIHSKSSEKALHPAAAVYAQTPQPVIAPRPVTVVARSPVPPSDVDVTEPSTPGDKIAKQALTYKGSKYKWGGTSKKGVDCSGLVMRVFEDLKMKQLPHASAALYSAGEPVRLSDLRPGDLVFFKNTYRRGISHVGVYAGHNKFIHASDHRHGVILTPLSDPYFQLHYAGARRLY